MTSDINESQNEQHCDFGFAEVMNWVLTVCSLILAGGCTVYAFVRVPEYIEKLRNLQVELPLLSIWVLEYYPIFAAVAITIAVINMILSIMWKSKTVIVVSILCLLTLCMIAAALYFGPEIPMMKWQQQSGF